MAHRHLKIRWVEWIDWVNLNKAEIYKILKKYDFHELDIEACMEENQKARLDVYKDYLFMILHFPKFNSKTQIYELNEFNIFLWKNYLITFRNFPWSHIDEIYEQYNKLDIDDNIHLKITSGFILYEIIQSMIEKIFKMSDIMKKDLKNIEKNVFENTNNALIKEMMIKKRNVIILKYMLVPQISVMKLIEDNVNKHFSEEMEVYFEDLEDKINHVVNDIKIIWEYIDSIEDAYKSIINWKTNSVMTFFTLFSAFLLPLTLITSFYWMNIELPYQQNPNFVFIFLLISILVMLAFIIYFRKKRII